MLVNPSSKGLKVCYWACSVLNEGEKLCYWASSKGFTRPD